DVGEASVGERVGQPLSREMNLDPGADAVCWAQGNTGGRAIASVRPTRRGLRTWHARKLFARKPGDLPFTPMAATPRGASGRRGAVADDAPTAEVGPRRSSAEAGEQARATGGGVGGAKAGGQGEHDRVAHAPDSEPGCRVPAARPCTASSKATQEGAVHSAVAPP